MGIVFRSKSEALFARALDGTDTPWLYEPSFLADGDGWKPDFLVLPRTKNAAYGAFCVEYKPAWPTETYLAELRTRFGRLSNDFGLACACAFGYFYGDRGVIEIRICLPDVPWGEAKTHTLFNQAQVREALEYRFDLRASA
jgi:hypothetical protein